MKLIFIYGPPASGKLTIAELLSELTGLPLFHNHLTRDIVRDLYKDKLNDHYELVDKLRIDVLDHCSKNNTDLIFTYVYEGIADDRNVTAFVKAIEDNQGEVFFVELTAEREDLISRVNNSSRKRFKKLTDPVLLAELTEDMSNYTIPYVEAIKINTSHSTPQESAQYIIDKFKLI